MSLADFLLYSIMQISATLGGKNFKLSVTEVHSFKIPDIYSVVDPDLVESGSGHVNRRFNIRKL
jgi:hypothetical protein